MKRESGQDSERQSLPQRVPTGVATIDRVAHSDPSSPGMPLDEMYRRRFAGEQAYRNSLWSVLCRDFFQQFVRETDVVAEIAAGHCEFINNISAGRKIAVDLNADTRLHAAAGVEVVIAPSHDLQAIASGSVDVAFVSNFFEHLTRDMILATLREIHRVLRAGGTLVVLQPNIRFTGRDYWMFFDHVTPLDDRSIAEAIELAGLRVERVVARFLPFTTRSRLPRALSLVRLYLRVPLLWRFFGGQALVVARRA